MTSLFLALVLFPHTQERAQAELDEVMRWLMVAPIGTI